MRAPQSKRSWGGWSNRGNRDRGRAPTLVPWEWLAVGAEHRRSAGKPLDLGLVPGFD